MAVYAPLLNARHRACSQCKAALSLYAIHLQHRLRHDLRRLHQHVHTSGLICSSQLSASPRLQVSLLK